MIIRGAYQNIPQTPFPFVTCLVSQFVLSGLEKKIFSGFKRILGGGIGSRLGGQVSILCLMNGLWDVLDMWKQLDLYKSSNSDSQDPACP